MISEHIVIKSISFYLLSGTIKPCEPNDKLCTKTVGPILKICLFPRERPGEFFFRIQPAAKVDQALKICLNFKKTQIKLDLIFYQKHSNIQSTISQRFPWFHPRCIKTYMIVMHASSI